MRELEPGAGKGVVESCLILMEAFRNLAIFGVNLERHVGVGHHGHATDRGVFHIDRHVFGFDIDGLVLPGAGRALGELPFVLEQHVEITVVPLRRFAGPGAFDAAGDGVATDATRFVIDPAQTLFFERCAFRCGAEVGCIAVAVRFADGVAASGEGDGFFVVHGHAGKGDAHVTGGFKRVGLAVNAFGVDVDQAHHDGGQRVFQIAFAGVTAAFAAALLQPFALGAPVGVFFRMPDVFAAEAEAEGFEAHRFIGHVAGQDHEVGPTDFVAVFFLDRPEQAARFVEVAVIGPRVERCKALVAGAGATAAIGDAVGACGVPSHADHETAVMAPVGRPPGLAVGHELREVVLERFDIKLFEFFPVIERRPHGISLGIVLMQDVQIQRLRPPGHYIVAAFGVCTVHDGAFALCAHTGLLLVLCEHYSPCVPIASNHIFICDG